MPTWRFIDILVALNVWLKKIKERKKYNIQHIEILQNNESGRFLGAVDKNEVEIDGPRRIIKNNRNIIIINTDVFMCVYT